MATFGLVHGAWHGAWCWERLTPDLEARGHRAVAVDLPCDDPTVTFPDYADVVERALEGADDVVLVGHSLGGQTIPLVAALPAAPSTYIVCRDEKTLNPERSRAVARDRLGAELVELPGGHSPFLSRPAQLAALLHDSAVR